MSEGAKEPIDRIVWQNADDLTANNYNPNVVFSPENKLLELSILSAGWTQPIIVSRDNIIIDGFHRWMLSRTSPAMRARYGGRVPTVVMDLDRAGAICMTIRMNRARGTHIAVRMSDAVHELVNGHGMTKEQIAVQIGATLDEVELLYQDNVFKARNLAKAPYSRAWYPVESKEKVPA